MEPSIDSDKLSYEVFSILETNFLFGYDDPKLWIPTENRARRKICILSVDAGAMPGFISATALSYLESSLRIKSGNPNARIADYFDVAAGAGVGGIFMAMLFASKDGTHPIFQAEETCNFLTGVNRKLRRRRLFGSRGKCKELKEAFMDEKTGRVLTLKDALKPILIPCYDLSTAAPFLFSRADALVSGSYDFSLWEVCSATAAVPGITGPVYMKSRDGSKQCVAIDGGIAMSNPTAAAMTHVLHNKNEFPLVRGVEDLIVVSIGQGGSSASSAAEVKDWVRALTRISGEASAEMVDQAVAMAFGHRRTSNYVRIQSNGMGGDMLKQRNVESVLLSEKKIGEKSNAEKLDWVAEQLVCEHRGGPQGLDHNCELYNLSNSNYTDIWKSLSRT